MDSYVIGIDPAYSSCGVAVIKIGATPAIVTSRSWEITAKERKLKYPETRRVGMVVDFVSSVVAPYLNQTKLVALEAGFVMAKHGRTSELLATARGGLLYWFDVQGLTVKSYAPTVVKKTLTGSGGAKKEVVQSAVEMWLGQPTRTDHESDACAVAYCAFLQERLERRMRGTI